MLISPEYAALNAEMHTRKPQYGTSGSRWAGQVAELALNIGASSILDYGAGKGSLAAALPQHFDILEYDPAIPGKEIKPLRADIVVCGDVLEHIEPDCLYDVLDDIRGIARKAVFLVVATGPASKHLPDGRNAHLIVEPASWWLRKIIDRWHVVSFRDIGPGFLCIGKTM